MSAIKLGALVIRTLAKPLAATIKERSKTSPRFKRICVGVAQSYHAWDQRIKMRFWNHRRAPIEPLSEERAIDTGANFLGEAIIFGVAGFVLIFETARSAVKTRREKAALEARLLYLESEAELLREALEEQVHVHLPPAAREAIPLIAELLEKAAEEQEREELGLKKKSDGPKVPIPPKRVQSEVVDPEEGEPGIVSLPIGAIPDAVVVAVPADGEGAETQRRLAEVAERVLREKAKRAALEKEAKGEARSGGKSV